MEPREFCCGSGGLWSLRYPELAERLRRIKLEDAERTGAEVVATGNPGCYLHLQGGEPPLVHIAELLAAAYGWTPEQTGFGEAQA
jgi:glycolate oxidase iron-sulfur subunit